MDVLAKLAGMSLAQMVALSVVAGLVAIILVLVNFAPFIKDFLASRVASAPKPIGSVPPTADWRTADNRAGIEIMFGRILILYGEFSISSNDALSGRLDRFLEEADTPELTINMIPATLISSVVLSRVMRRKFSRLVIVHTDEQAEELEILAVSKRNHPEDYGYLEMVNVGKVV